MRHLENWPMLLANIADGLKKMSGFTKLDSLEVVFQVRHDDHRRYGDGWHEYSFTLSAALDAIANDLYWDERGNWSKATRAIVRVM